MELYLINFCTECQENRQQLLPFRMVDTRGGFVFLFFFFWFVVWLVCYLKTVHKARFLQSLKKFWHLKKYQTQK